MKLWHIGLIILLVSLLISVLLVHAEIGGLIRDLFRILTLAGLVLLIYGLIKHK